MLPAVEKMKKKPVKILSHYFKSALTKEKNRNLFCEVEMSSKLFIDEKWKFFEFREVLSKVT